MGGESNGSPLIFSADTGRKKAQKAQ